MKERFGFRIILGLALLFLLISSATASTIYHHDLDPEHMLFGNLKQTDVPDCGDGLFACGPTAAVNSFAFLQRKFPDVYDHKLIPDSDMDGEIDYEELIATAVALGDDEYMMCAACQGGTLISDFISGKRKWINERAPNSTIFKHKQGPDWQFLFGELWDMEHVELLFGFYDRDGNRLGGHYVTLTKFWWEDSDMDDRIDQNEGAAIGFVDPADGMLKMQDLAQSLTGTDLFTDYAVGFAINSNTIAFTQIEWAVSESPIPEPQTILLLFLGTSTLMGFVRQCRA